MTLLHFLEDKGLSILFVILHNIVNHGLLLLILFAWMDIVIPPSRTLLCALCATLIYLGPTYVVDFFLFTTGAVCPEWLYSMMLFINPLAAVVYYRVMQSVLRLQPTKTSILLRNHLMLHYVVVFAYLALLDGLSAALPMRELAPGFFLHDCVAIFIVMAGLLVLYLAIRFYLGRTRHYLTLPPLYAEKRPRRYLLETVFTLVAFYAVAIVYRAIWDASDPSPAASATDFVYILLIVCALLFVYCSQMNLRASLLEYEVQAAGTYASSLLHVNQELRALRHDYANMLQGYGGYIAIGDFQGLSRYHQSLFGTIRHAGELGGLLEVLKSRVAVYSLLEAKIAKAHEAGVTFSINKACDIRNVVLSDLDLCRVLGIVLDNAIEAAGESAAKQVNMTFEPQHGKAVLFAVSNTTKGSVDTQRIFRDGYTTKAGHSGIGLPEVIHLLQAYVHCALRISYHDNQFTAFLILHAEK